MSDLRNRRFAACRIAWVLAIAMALSGCSYMPSWMGGEKKKEEKLAGERITIMPGENQLASDPGIQAVPYRAPEAYKNSGWPQHSGNWPAEKGNLFSEDAFTPASSATIGEGNDFPSMMVIQPVVADGMVYAMDAAGYISAHDANNISNTAWISDGTSDKDETESSGGGLAYDNGVLYAVSGRDIIAAIDGKTGQMLWRKSLELAFRSPPRISHGRLFAITLDNQLYTLQTATGEVLWTHRGISETTDIMHVISPAIYGDRVIVPYSSGEVYALSAASGQEIWRDSVVASLGGLQSSVSFTGIGGDPVLDGEALFLVSTGGIFSARHVSGGQPIWQREVGSINTPWLAGDYIYLLTHDNRVVSFVKYSGKIRWSTRLASYEDEEEKEDPILWKGPVMVNGTLVAVGSDGRLVRLDAGDGSVLARQELPDDDICSAPVIAQGRMYLVGQDATLYSFE